MKRSRAFVFISIMGLFGGCLYEPPRISYIFKIKNNLKDTLFIEYKTINDNVYTHYDTLQPDTEFTEKVDMRHCYEDYYKDSLIFYFFGKLKITAKKNKLVDPFNRKNWREKLNLNESDCSGGEVLYEIDILKGG